MDVHVYCPKRLTAMQREFYGAVHIFAKYDRANFEREFLREKYIKNMQD